jgi:hypothetical protein
LVKKEKGKKKAFKRASRELCREHPCTDIELIEGSFDSSSWFVLFSLCIVDMLMNVCFCYEFALYMLGMRFPVSVEV